MLRVKTPILFVTSLALVISFLTPPAHTANKDIQVKVIKLGKGDEAVTNSRVTVHYTGWLKKDDKKFDSSVDRGKPFSFTLGVQEVIKGWDLGVAGMRVGGKRMLIIPPHLGYGSRGAGQTIPPKAYLKFEIELLAVEAAKYSNINNIELKLLLDRGVEIVDIRRQEEWDTTGIIKDSQKVTSFNENGDFIKTFVQSMMAVTSPEKEVIIICRSGNRTVVIAKFLTEQHGFKKVYNVTNGISKWIKDGFPVVK
jgi:rhodanese-related sulfurtransferase